MSTDAGPIGGYFESENLSLSRSEFHADSLALASGRSCLAAILEYLKPNRIWLPFYICDSVILACRRLNIPIHFYPIDRSLRAVLPDEGTVSDAILAVNYFGLVSQIISSCPGCILDNSQDFFRPLRTAVWNFNSARKFFGVADGGYVRGPATLSVSGSPNLLKGHEFLRLRREGRVADGYESFTRYEENVSYEPQPISEESRGALRRIDYAAVKSQRQRNFARYHSRLAQLNELRWQDNTDVVPMCYPFLPPRTIDRRILHKKQLFVGQYWQECLSRAEPSGFEWERHLSATMLALPVDQRYGDTDINRVIDEICAL